MLTMGSIFFSLDAYKKLFTTTGVNETVNNKEIKEGAIETPNHYFVGPV